VRRARLQDSEDVALGWLAGQGLVPRRKESGRRIARPRDSVKASSQAFKSARGVDSRNPANQERASGVQGKQHGVVRGILGPATCSDPIPSTERGGWLCRNLLCSNGLGAFLRVRNIWSLPKRPFAAEYRLSRQALVIGQHIRWRAAIRQRSLGQGRPFFEQGVLK